MKFYLKLLFTIFIASSIGLIFTSCTSTKNNSNQPQSFLLDQTISYPQKTEIQPIEQKKLPDNLKLSFAGDIMAHTVNFNTSNYDDIYADISDHLKNDDFSFANLETPVHNQRPYETYPTFNVKQEYPNAAINAGFDVFSLANNHSGDQDTSGIEETYNYFLSTKDKGIYYAGIKPKNISPEEIDIETGLTFQIIKKENWTILFIAITELLNDHKNERIINYIPYTKNGREKMGNSIKSLRDRYPCDIFVVSIHINEVEYEKTISQTRKDYYYELLDNGVDIIWANHPHILQDWEVIQYKQDKEFVDANTQVSNQINESPANSNITLSGNKIIFYSLGNCISGQRSKPSYNKPDTKRDYTGDSCIMNVQVLKDDNKLSMSVTPILTTNYIKENNDYVIRRFTDEFITSFSSNEQLQTYYSNRHKLMSEIKGTIICK